MTGPTGDTAQPSYLRQPVGMFLGGLAAGTPAPAGGSAAALTVALGAALCAKTARLSARQLAAERAERLTSEAERIRTSAAALIDLDALVYRGVIEASRRPAGQAPASTAPASTGSAGMEPAAAPSADRLAAALSAAAEVPMQVAELAAEVAGLAATLAADGNPALHGDAITAALLAEAGARAAGTLVGIDLAAAPEDERHERIARLLGGLDRQVRALGQATSAQR